jgi:hypothetical protein
VVDASYGYEDGSVLEFRYSEQAGASYYPYVA